MNTEEINKLLKEYGERTKQKIDLIKPMNEQTDFTGQLSEEEKEKFYKKQEKRQKTEETEHTPPPE